MPKMNATTNPLLTIPNNIGQAIVQVGAVIACPLLGTDRFIEFCKKRDIAIDRERLFRLEHLRLFAPVFRVLTPQHVPPLGVSVRTLRRWRAWWQNEFVTSALWLLLRGWLAQPIEVTRLPAALLECLAGEDWAARLTQLLRLISPLSTRSYPREGR